jgi:molybdenum cofactor guanylyltransferase
MNPPALAGLVLTGGFSTRLGRDKGSLPWQGRKLAHHQAEKLARLLPQVYLSCRPEQEDLYAGPFSTLPDSFPSGGPISGLLSAMSASSDSAWLTLAVDMPGISGDTLRHLLTHRDPTRIATAFRQPDGIIQPLVAIWEPAALPLLLKAWQAQRLSLRRILEDGQARILDPLDGEDWRNLNTPGDWQDFTVGADPSGPLQEP